MSSIAGKVLTEIGLQKVGISGKVLLTIVQIKRGIAGYARLTNTGFRNILGLATLTAGPLVSRACAGLIKLVEMRYIEIKLISNRPCTVYYTLDGTMPTKDSVVYQGPILIGKDTILKFIGIDSFGVESQVFTEVYTDK